MLATRESDLLTEAGALALAAVLRSYWDQRGWDICVWVEKCTRREYSELVGINHLQGQVWKVRSDLKNGLPQRRKR